MREVLKFWAGLGVIVGGIFALVAVTMGAMSLFMSPKAAGLVWCGFMFLGIIVVGSYWVYDDQRREHRYHVVRSLHIISCYSAHLGERRDP